MKKISILDMQKMKKSGKPLTWITAYDMPFASAAERAGIDMILVGDSGGMVQLGYQTTNPVTMDEMILLSSAVRRGAPNTFIIGDMPQGSYEISDEDAVRNAMRFVKESGCDAIKLEGGRRVASRVEAISRAGILVIGHLGLTPQSTSSFGGYRVQCKNKDNYDHLVDDCLSLQKSGVFAILLEALPAAPAKQVAKFIDVPIYGIGAGLGVDGQLIIMHDLMGFYNSFRPMFAKCYIPSVINQFKDYIDSFSDLISLGRTERRDGLLVLAEMAIAKYIEEVHSGTFPSAEYTYPLDTNQLEDLRKSRYWRVGEE